MPDARTLKLEGKLYLITALSQGGKVNVTLHAVSADGLRWEFVINKLMRRSQVRSLQRVATNLFATAKKLDRV